MARHLLSIKDLTRAQADWLVEKSLDLKEKLRRGIPHKVLLGKSVAMLFDKPSLRTHVSFEVGIKQLGGNVTYLEGSSVGVGKREEICDIARNLNRFVDGIVIRTFAHKIVVEFAKYSEVPVINALTDRLHPCQVLADMLTLKEKFGKIDGVNLTFIGDGNNMANSLINAASIYKLNITIACPSSLSPDEEITESAKSTGAGNIVITDDIESAVGSADVIYTDTWVSMGDEEEPAEKKKLLLSYQVNESLLKKAPRDVLVMHCLPAHRGEEITDGVLDGSNSIVFDQAENRLHMQKAIMVFLLYEKPHRQNRSDGTNDGEKS